MPDTTLVANHYTHGSLVDAIRQGISWINSILTPRTMFSMLDVDSVAQAGLQRISMDVA